MGIYEVRRYCDDCGEWRTIRAAQKNERNPNVKCRKHYARRPPSLGGRITHASGYVIVRTEAGWEYEHRVVWSERNGPIPDRFHVHHLNGVRDDNRLENLALVDGRAHNREHTQERHDEGSLSNRGADSGRWLHELDNDEIVRRRNRGESFRSIARSLGVSPPTVANHYRRATEG
jgi:DNA-binding CsgD family transcriptional regulator